jgi:hypothetical protein
MGQSRAHFAGVQHKKQKYPGDRQQAADRIQINGTVALALPKKTREDNPSAFD